MVSTVMNEKNQRFSNVLNCVVLFFVFFSDSNLHENFKQVAVEEGIPSSSYHLIDSDSEPDCGVDDDDELGWSDGEDEEKDADDPLRPSYCDQPPKNISNPLPSSCYEKPPTSPSAQQKDNAANKGTDHKKKNKETATKNVHRSVARKTGARKTVARKTVAQKTIARKIAPKEKLLPKKNEGQQVGIKPRVRIGKRVADKPIRYREDLGNTK